MNLAETARLQALKLKQLNHQGHSGDFDLVDQFAQDPDFAEAMKAQTKNICAHISLALFDRVEGMCHTLSMSKRQFVELALVDALEKATAVIEEVQPFPEEVR